ncbi:MAG: amidohydrolase [Eubacteriales bacterium]|nr:amidohydrolase [Eubacteriales bacterium]
MQKLFCNGAIYTMEEGDRAEAVLTDEGRIQGVGRFEELRRQAPLAELVDLKGYAMLPAFLDSHSHLSSYAMSFLQAPLEECYTFQEILERVQGFIRENKLPPGDWVVGKGYDHNSLAERRHPTLALLDQAAPHNPLMLQHASGHVGVFNSLALKALGITPDVPSPEGGVIGKEDGRLTGYLEENAYFAYMKKVPAGGVEDLKEGYRRAQEGYASRGITSVQEGMAVDQMVPLYQMLLRQDLLDLDVTAYVALGDGQGFLEAFPQAVRSYDRHFRIGGYKIFLDGSPQGRTAWMRTPYKGGEGFYYGYGTMKDEAVLEAVKKAAADDMQLLAHCNGDRAAQQYLKAIGAAGREWDVKRIRPVLIHGQLLGVDQLEEVKALGVIPSFFAAHVYHWGDVHIQNFGRERASRISPAASALKRNILFTFHQDTPVIPPNMMETVWCAVRRITKSGVVLGEEERISVREAFRAITINSAYQYFEEDKKGSIKVGKDGDFVILEQDPFAAGHEELRDISVLGTFKKGEAIFGGEWL